MEKATFGGGCFWCTEAIFKRIRGVQSVISGYTGGRRENPSYDQVSTGVTGHVEAIQIVFDQKVIPFTRLLDIFWATHDPTTLNQQGADVGTQYRSVIFYHSEKQKQEAEASKEKLEKSGTYTDPVVTEILPFNEFFTAEEYHQNYYDANRNYPYCRVVIDPKVQKLLKEFAKDVKDEYKNA